MSSEGQQPGPGDETDIQTMAGKGQAVSNVNNSCPVAPALAAEEYNMAHPTRGKALIFNHTKFQNADPRNGSDKDCIALAKVLGHLAFEVKVHSDLPCRKLKEELARVAREDHTNADCLLIAVLSHGEKSVLHAEDVVYGVQQLWDPFLGNKCPSLAGKPKIFIIQACRGKKYDSGVSVRTETDDQEGCYTIPAYSDILIAYSTVEDTELIEDDSQKPDKASSEDGDKKTTTASPDIPPSNDVSLGHKSWRNPSDGSWFIQALVEELKENGRKRDLQTLLTFVARRVAVEKMSNRPDALESHEKKQAPVFTSSLTRLVFFR